MKGARGFGHRSGWWVPGLLCSWWRWIRGSGFVLVWSRLFFIKQAVMPHGGRQWVASAARGFPSWY